MALWWTTIVACLLVLMRSDSATAQSEADFDDVILTPTVTQKCTTKNGEAGTCVHYTLCTEAHQLNPPDLISEDLLRAGQCAGIHDWCCINPAVPAKVITEPTSACALSSDDGTCSWCVALYRKCGRDGGNPRTKNPSGLFCGGALLGSRVVLTAATCVLAAREQNFSAVVGASAARPVVNSYVNPHYNSGTYESDIALLVLEPQEGASERGACLSKTAPTGDCLATGWARDDSLVQSTVSSVKTGRCGAGGGAGRGAGGGRGRGAAMCAQTGGECAATAGAPLVCAGQATGVTAGGGCGGGGIAGTPAWRTAADSGPWLHSVLDTLGLSEGAYRA